MEPVRVHRSGDVSGLELAPPPLLVGEREASVDDADAGLLEKLGEALGRDEGVFASHRQARVEPSTRSK